MILKKIKDKIFDLPLLFNTIRYILVGGKSRLNKEIFDAIKPKEDEKILDIGCGTCEFSELINSKYIGIDLNKSFLKKAKKKFPDRILMEIDAKNINFGKKSFDKILMMNFLHHFSDEDCKIILNEAKMVLKNKIVIEDNIIPTKGFINKLLVKLDRGDYIRTKDQEIDLVKEFFKIGEIKTFKSGFYEFIVIIGHK